MLARRSFSEGGKPGDDDRERGASPWNDRAQNQNTPPHSRGPIARVLPILFPLKKGSRECRVRAAPAVSCANCAKEAHTSIQVQRKHSGIPRAMALRLMARSPRRRIRLVTVTGGLRFCRTRLSSQHLRRFDTSNGCRNHTLLPYAATRLRQPPSSETGLRRVKRLNRAKASSSGALQSLTAEPPCDHPSRPTLPRPPHPTPTFVTMAKRPLVKGMRRRPLYF